MSSSSESSNLDCWTLKMKALKSFETSESIRPVTRSHVREYYNRQQIQTKVPNCRKENKS